MGRRPCHQTDAIGDGLMGVGLLAGPANVIMQMSQPAVGRGVVESRVESGRLDRHPLKRARTTFTYLAVAIAGSDAQKAAFRRAVNRVHAQVYSTPESPVAYNAFDKDLQLWVAACMYKGALDVYRMFVGDMDSDMDSGMDGGMDEETADEHYRASHVLATTLQVPPDMWPADRAAFDRYWCQSLRTVHMDDAVREYLYPVARARIPGLTLPRAVQGRVDGMALLITTGFLPQQFRDEMGLPWDADRQRRFERLMRTVRAVNRLLPGMVRRFPFNVLLWDLDRRVRTRRALV